MRENVRKLEAYVEEMARSNTVSGSVNIQKVQDDVMKLWTIVKSQLEITQDQKNRIKSLYEGVVCSLRTKGAEPCPRTHRSCRSSSQFLRPQISGVATVSADKVPLLHLKRKVGTNWSTAVISPVFISTSFMRLPLPGQHSKTRMRCLPGLVKV